MRRWVFIALVIPFASGLGCARAKSASTEQVARGEPVVQYWDNGIYLAHIKPYPLFAAWSDGTIVCRIRKQLYVGKVPPADVTALVDRIVMAGFFDPPLQHGLVKVDGPAQTLRVVRDGEAKQLTHDGSYGATQMGDIGPQASPSREQVPAFLGVWAKSIAPLEEIAPERLTRFHAEFGWELHRAEK